MKTAGHFVSSKFSFHIFFLQKFFPEQLHCSWNTSQFIEWKILEKLLTQSNFICNTFLVLLLQILLIKCWEYLPQMPTYSSHSCIFNLSPSLWLWKMNCEFECLIFLTHRPLCWMLDPEELEDIEMVPGTPDSNQSPAQPPARRQLSAGRTSIIHPHIHNDKFLLSFMMWFYWWLFHLRFSVNIYWNDIIIIVIFWQGYEVHRTNQRIWILII